MNSNTAKLIMALFGYTVAVTGSMAVKAYLELALGLAIANEDIATEKNIRKYLTQIEPNDLDVVMYGAEKYLKISETRYMQARFGDFVRQTPPSHNGTTYKDSTNTKFDLILAKTLSFCVIYGINFLHPEVIKQEYDEIEEKNAQMKSDALALVITVLETYPGSVTYQTVGDVSDSAYERVYENNPSPFQRRLFDSDSETSPEMSPDICFETQI
jgi:hypothetical protein